MSDFDFTPHTEEGIDPLRIKGIVLGILWILISIALFSVGGRAITTGVYFVAMGLILINGNTIIYGAVA